jgi:transcriptional antiterminator NusG
MSTSGDPIVDIDPTVPAPDAAGADAPAEAVDLLPTGTLVLDPTDAGPEAASEAAQVADQPDEEEAAEAQVEESAEEAVVPDEPVVDEDELLDGDSDEESTPVVESAYDRRGNWYVVHTQSGYEKKVRQNLQARTASMHLEDRILEVEIPMEDVDEFRNGKKVTISKKVFPGYLLVRCYLDDEAWSAIRDTPGIVNFVGAGGKPSRLSRKEVETFLPVADESESVVPKRSKARLGFGVGDTVRVKEGPFADFSGAIQEINEDQLKVKVLVNIFGRETPVELEFAQVAQL